MTNRAFSRDATPRCLSYPLERQRGGRPTSQGKRPKVAKKTGGRKGADTEILPLRSPKLRQHHTFPRRQTKGVTVRPRPSGGRSIGGQPGGRASITMRRRRRLGPFPDRLTDRRFLPSGNGAASIPPDGGSGGHGNNNLRLSTHPLHSTPSVRPSASGRRLPLPECRLEH